MRRTTSFFISFFFILLTLAGQAVSLSVAQDATWLRKGAYSKYSSSKIPSGRVVYPNGTKIKFTQLSVPSVLQWEVLDVSGSTAHLRITFRIEGKARIIESDDENPKDVVYQESVLIDVDLGTKNASIDGDTIGKLSFWSETEVALGQKLVLASSPSDLIEGNVTRFGSAKLVGRQMEDYEVEVFQLDPFIYTQLAFENETGIALNYVLVGPVEIIPDSVHTYTFENGTVYNITSYARTRFAEELGIEETYLLTLSETNISLGQAIQTIPSEWYIIAFAVLFVSLFAIFILVDRSRRKKAKTSKHRKSA
jgi:hypothetical protein